MKRLKPLFAALLLVIFITASFAVDYPIVDTQQESCFNNSSEISEPSVGSAFYGQDAQYDGNLPDYVISGDGLTVYDNATGLTWIRSGDTDGDGDTDADDKLNWEEIQGYPDILNAEEFGGYDDWRVPTIKELYSLIDFRGQDISGYTGDLSSIQPFIDDDVFDFAYGDESSGERAIDSQYGSSTVYNETTIPGVPKLFGVNFADGRIKGYDTELRGTSKTFTLICVRGNPNYGVNDFADLGDGTIIDSSTGLMWQKGHTDEAISWQDALEYAENLTLAGYTDWRLPNAKELQSILDYTRSPGSTSSAAIDSIFTCESIINESGRNDYPWFWTSTTHRTVYGGSAAAYVCFGRATGWMEIPPGSGSFSHIDVHGAGAQRSDPKTGDITDYYLGVDSLGDPVYGHGPQGDNIRIENYVRCVRDSDILNIKENPKPKSHGFNTYPNPFNSAMNIEFALAESSNIRLDIFDIKGNYVKTIANGQYKSGNYAFKWNGNDSEGNEVVSGLYLARLATEFSEQSRIALYVK
ncbi:MAG: DUF1566 domain-containing protein [Candidatus Zixiibacteriota bacterium]